MTVKTRFAPSPTGYLHLGGVRTALFSWLYARRHGGRFVLRIEDTDRERSTEESIAAILDGLTWLGIDFDEGPFRQMERLDRYRAVAEQMLSAGAAYRCYCSREELEAMRRAQVARGENPRYDGRCRHRRSAPAGIQPVIRFRNPDEGVVVVDDLVHGRVVFRNAELDDLILVRSDGVPTFHFGVVVDDADMGITHVIRGDDHLNNTPRQINLLHALGWSVPSYAHVPMILGPDGARLSKRHGAVNVLEYRARGYLPEAMLNYLVRLGWSHGDQEVFSRAEMISLFDIGAVNTAASRFSPEKLLWLNQQYIKSSLPDQLAPHLAEQFRRRGVDPLCGPPMVKLIEAYRERAATLDEMVDAAWYVYHDFAEFDEKAARQHLKPAMRGPLTVLRERLARVNEWSRAPIQEVIASVAAETQLGFGKIGQPLRVAVTGRGVSPPIDVTLELIGRARVLQRLHRAIEYIDSQSSS